MVAQKFDSALMLTGGLDSATLGYWLKDSGRSFRSVFLSQDFAASPRERESARFIAGSLSSPLDEIDTRALDGYFRTLRPEADIGAGRSSEGGAAQVPGITVALQIAIFHCQLLGINNLYLGVLADQLGNKQETLRYLDLLSQATALLRPSGEPFFIHVPFIDFTKPDVAKEAVRLGVPIERTWTCLEGESMQCGRCRQCTARRLAFSHALAVDPTDYLADQMVTLRSSARVARLC